MGQTLTHGVYLPSEGERNCYNGLASNWRLLDGAIGTVAAHTTAIAGKADISHTHGNITNDGKVGTTANLPLITGTGGVVQAGAFGNQANTFCEGNDSRLSDARTPVAHTHTKADVTDLLNSNFIPSANNSYDLGSSSYQWNKIYSADVVHTSGNETITGVKTFSNGFSINGSSPRLQTKSTTYSSATSSGMTIGDIAFLNKDGGFSAWIVHQLKDDLTKRICFRVYPHPGGSYKGFAFDDTCTLYPENTNSALGSSTNKWKSLNGINPGALSLPGTGGYTDIKGDITNLSGGDNSFTAPYDGWVCIKSTNATIIHIINANWAVCQSATRSTAGTLCCLCPVISGESFSVIVNATSLEYAYIHPCKGNV